MAEHLVNLLEMLEWRQQHMRFDRADKWGGLQHIACLWCQQDWPCQVVRLLDYIDIERAALRWLHEHGWRSPKLQVPGDTMAAIKALAQRLNGPGISYGLLGPVSAEELPS